MKGLSVAIVGSLVLALIGVTVMIALFSDISPLDTDSGFCSVYNSLGPSLPDAIAPSVAGCEEGTSVDYREISTSDHNEFTLKLASGILDCWEENRGYDVDFKRCKAWEISGLDQETNESYLNRKMNENKICPDLIENSELEGSGSETCGSSNDIVFRLDEIKDSDFVIIGFNSSQGSQFVEVQ